MAAAATFGLASLELEHAATFEKIKTQLAVRYFRQTVSVDAADIGEAEFSPAAIANLLLTRTNGDLGLPEQKVRVEYLRSDQKLRVPAHLGVSTTVGVVGLTEAVTALTPNYLKLARTPYVDLYNFLQENRTLRQVRDFLDAIPNPANITAQPNWLNEGYYTLPDGEAPPNGTDDVIFGMFSMAANFNCDVRDVGALLRPDMRMADNYWMGAAAVPSTRLNSKLRPYTMQSIAALNYAHVHNEALAAWVRAYGVSAGILPNAASRSISEYVLTKSHAPRASLDAILKEENEARYDMGPVCMNLIAMFGLFHLNKDHTYKTNDANMERICTSYVNTLRTMLDGPDMERIRGKLEPYCRTAAHPFGLGQTYSVAKIMARNHMLAPALAIRVDVTPPPVQRIMIVHAAEREWGGLSSGSGLNAMFEDARRVVNVAYDRIVATPPSFSSLHLLYGVTSQLLLTDTEVTAANTMMPCVCGYSACQHEDADGKKDGIALALSLANVKRDFKAQVSVFTSLWENFISGIDKAGLVKYVEEVLESRARLEAAGYGQSQPV